MGLGKTLIALTYLRIRTEQRPVLVVCPASAKWVWRAETRQYTRYSGRILNGKTPKRLDKKRDLIIINYDILPAWVDVLARMNFQVMILDECQYVKNWRAKRTRAVVRLGKRIPHILALSGTPLTNRPKELYTIVHLINPTKFSSFMPYAFRYCNRRATPWGWDDKGASHLDELHDVLNRSCMIRHTKAKVLHELPPKRRFVVPLPIQHKSEYREAENNFVQWLVKHELRQLPPNELAKFAATRLTKGREAALNPGIRKAKAVSKVGYLLRLAAKLKMKYVTEWIDDFFEETDEKLVVFAHHRFIIERLKQKYPRKSVVLDGRTPQRARRDVVRRFQQNDNTRLFIGQIVAAGTAITLTAASTCMFAELNWVPGNHIQAEDRLHRIGQKDHVQAYYLVGRSTIEEKLCRIIQKKAAVITAVLDGEQSRNEMNVFDQLLKSLTKKGRKE
jgi:SWI/SNF-related matrix-associated actin-dependent regulator 1 of chromatin subfamily A